MTKLRVAFHNFANVPKSRTVLGMPGIMAQWRKKNNKKKTNRKEKEIKKVMLEGTKTIKIERGQDTI